MRIAVITNNPDFFLSHRLGCAEYLQKLGHDVVVITPDGESVETIRQQGFEFEPIVVNRKSTHLWTEFQSLLSHIDAVKNARPDIILNFTLKSILYGTIAGRINKVERVVNTYTGFGTLYLAQGFKYKVLRHFVSFLFKTVFNHPRVLCNFQNFDDQKYATSEKWIPKERSTVIVGSGINVERFRSPAKLRTSEVKILFPSRLLFDKGIRELIDACEILNFRGFSFKLQIAGDIDLGNSTSVSQSYVDTWKVRSYIQVLGRVSNMIDLYRECDIVCLPSYREGAPRSLIEACAASRPIVTTDVPGCNEVVRHAVNGLLVPAKTIEPLADALADLIKSPDKRKMYGGRGLERAKREFDIDHVMEKFCLFAGITKTGESKRHSA